jgi:metallophosphoesterase (TIGR00282 family)
MAPLAVVNLQGRVFMSSLDCPFQTAEKILPEISKKARMILVDFHAEATSEKMAMGWFLDGKVSAVIGTHTHVQTADERILPQGTAYITDAGMTGGQDSIIGMKKKPALERFLSQMPQSYDVSHGAIGLQGVLITLDPETGRAQGIKRINQKMDDPI